MKWLCRCNTRCREKARARDLYAVKNQNFVKISSCGKASLARHALHKAGYLLVYELQHTEVFVYLYYLLYSELSYDATNIMKVGLER